MKTTLKIIPYLAFAILTINVQAQPKLTEERREEITARMEAYKEALNLTPEQSEKVKEINATYFSALAELRDSDASRFSKLRKFRALRSDKDKQMKALLTKEQFKTYQQLQKEVKEELKERRQS